MSKNFYAERIFRHQNVAGSFFLYKVHFPSGKEVEFFFEAGAKQGEKDIGDYNGFIPVEASNLSFGIISHTHFDHIGLLPVLIRQGFKGPIFTSYPASKLLEIGLQDSAKIVDKNLERTIAVQEEVEQTLSQVVGAPYKKKIKPHKNITVTFFMNGHLIGAVLTLITITYSNEEPIYIVHSGDYKSSNMFFNVEQPQEAIRNLPISNFVIESTYGDVDSSNIKFKKCLKNNTLEALNNGFTVVYPTFSLGRHQEALYLIKLWQKQELIPADTQIIVDGKSAQAYNYLIKFSDLGVKPGMNNFMPQNTISIPRNFERKAIRAKVLKSSAPKIILSPGGMGSYGPITYYIQNLAFRDDVLIHSLGYSSPDSTMYKLLKAKYGETIKYNGLDVTVKCQTAQTCELSAHDPRDKLLKLIESFPETHSVSINHGDLEIQKSFWHYLNDHLLIPSSQIATSKQSSIRIFAKGIEILN